MNEQTTPASWIDRLEVEGGFLDGLDLQFAPGQHDKVSVDITWLRDESLEDVDNLPPPEVIAQEIVEDLEAALAEFSQIAASLGQRDVE